LKHPCSLCLKTIYTVLKGPIKKKIADFFFFKSDKLAWQINQLTVLVKELNKRLFKVTIADVLKDIVSFTFILK